MQLASEEKICEHFLRITSIACGWICWSKPLRETSKMVYNRFVLSVWPVQRILAKWMISTHFVLLPIASIVGCTLMRHMAEECYCQKKIRACLMELNSQIQLPSTPINGFMHRWMQEQCW